MVKFIGEDGFYPKWAQGEGRWVHQRVLVVTGSMPSLEPPEANRYLIWVPPKSGFLGARKSSPQVEARRASEELNQIRFYCFGCGWEGMGNKLVCSGGEPRHWLLQCPECFVLVAPDLRGLGTEVIIEQWQRLGRPALENPGASWNIVSIKPVNDLRNWIDSFEPMANELAYVGQQLWPNFASFMKDAQQLESYIRENEETFTVSVDAWVVYFGSEDGNLYALDAQTGKLKWRYQTGDSIYSSPTVANGMVYFGSHDNKLYAVDAATGELKWSYKTQDFINSCPAVANGIVYFGSADNKLYALDAITGELKWSYKTRGRVLCSPSVEAGIVYCGSEDGYWYALDGVTGKLRWQYKTESDNGYSTPGVAAGLVYFVNEGENKIYALDALTGKLKWDYSSQSEFGISRSATLMEGIPFFGDENDIWALKPATGELEWSLKDSRAEFVTEELGAWTSINGFDIENGMAYVVGDDAILALHLPRGSVTWKYELKDLSCFWGTPSVNGRMLLLTCEEKLYALDALTGDYRWDYDAKSEIGTSPVVTSVEPVSRTDDGPK